MIRRFLLTLGVLYLGVIVLVDVDMAAAPREFPRGAVALGVVVAMLLILHGKRTRRARR